MLCIDVCHAHARPCQSTPRILDMYTEFSCWWETGGGSHRRIIPPPPAHARPCLSTRWALNSFEEILGPLFLWSRMEDWVFGERLCRERGAQGAP